MTLPLLRSWTLFVTDSRTGGRGGSASSTILRHTGACLQTWKYIFTPGGGGGGIYAILKSGSKMTLIIIPVFTIFGGFSLILVKMSAVSVGQLG